MLPTTLNLRRSCRAAAPVVGCLPVLGELSLRSQFAPRPAQKDVLELCPRSFDVFLQVGFVVENPKPKQQVEQGLNMDRINEINDWFWNPV